MLSLLFFCEIPFSVNFDTLTNFHPRPNLYIQKVQPGYFSGCYFAPISGKLVTHSRTREWI